MTLKTQQRKQNADIVNIGGGVVGCSIAYYLSEYKAGNVILIERNTIGSGNTGYAASLLTTVRKKTSVIPLVKETYKAMEVLENQYGCDIGRHEVGSLHVASSDQSVADILGLVDIARSHHIPNEWIDHARIKEMVPWLALEEIMRASYMPEDSYIDAYLLAHAFAKAASKNGVEIRQSTEVTNIEKSGGLIKGVKTSLGETIETRMVIDAAGAWANILSLEIGIALPMAPVRSNYWITSPDRDKFPASQPIVILPDAQAYTRPESGGLLFGLREPNPPHFNPLELPGSLGGYAFGPPGEEWDILATNGQRMRRFFPDFEEMSIAHYIAGLSTYTPDGLFILGAMPGIEGFLAATGCSGAGVAGSGGMGRVIAELAMGIKPFSRIDDFNLMRFGEVNPLSVGFREKCAAARASKNSG